MLPLQPQGLYERVGVKCASDDGSPVSPDDVGDHNLFYYFDTTLADCPLTEAELAVGTYEVTSSLDAPTVYPEYDQLVEDGKITMVAIFGQIEHGDLSNWDWGFISFGDFTEKLEDMGFSVSETYPERRGKKMKKTYASGLEVIVDVYTPIGFADDVPRDESNERFREAVRSNEIVYYNGHAFYGSLDVLDEPTAYPTDVYQIINMDACLVLRLLHQTSLPKQGHRQ